MNPLLRYALMCVTLVLLGGAAGALGGRDVRNAVWVGGVLSLLVQVIAFTILQRVWGKPQEFMIGWLLGMVLRLVVVVVVALWVTWSGALAAAPLLLSMVAFLFVMVLMEPMFLKKGPRSA